MGNCFSITDASEKILKALPVETAFKFPSPLPTFTQGGGFAKGTIDLGGLEVSQVPTFNKVWSTYEGGPDNLGVTFFEPSSVPTGFSILGYYAQPNNRQLFGWVLVAKDLSSNNTLKPPVDYTLVGNTESLVTKQDGPGYFWEPVAPDGYQAVGLIVTNSSQKPPLDKVRCVRSDLTEQCEADTSIWESNGVKVSTLRPTIRGTQATGVCVGTFTWQPQNTSPPSLSCLKNKKLDFSTMPNGSQTGVLSNTYSPLIYLHPDEEYLPSSVNWYFSNGALLYKRGEESNPNPIEPNGANLPQGGANDGSYWLDLPIDKKGKERVKKGDLQSTQAYLHIKPMLGATFTDIAIWVFYPFNGPARAKVKLITLPLGRIGEHIGDWEHVTLRISNFNGELWRVFLSQHSGGEWIDACDLEFQEGGGSNKAVAYASLHGHAMYPKPGLVLQGNDGVGIRNDTAKSKKVFDTGLGYEVIAAEYGGEGGGVVEPPWVNYYRKWGPKIDYSVEDDVKRIERFLFGALKRAFVNLVKKIPNQSINFIVSSCRTTRYPKLCIKCLAAFASKIHHNENRLARTALAVTLVRVRSTTVYVAKLTRARRIKRREYLAVKDCVENLGDGLGMLVQSMREMKKVGRSGRSRDEFLWRLSNVETWVSAALTDETTCLDGFDGKVMDGVVKSAIRRRVVHVARVTSNALALVNRFAARH